MQVVVHHVGMDICPTNAWLPCNAPGVFNFGSVLRDSVCVGLGV